MEKICQSISIKLPLDEVTQEHIDDINQLVDTYKGNKRVNFTIFDPEKEKINIQLPLRKTGLKVNKELLDELIRRNYLQMSINN